MFFLHNGRSDETTKPSYCVWFLASFFRTVDTNDENLHNTVEGKVNVDPWLAKYLKIGLSCGNLSPQTAYIWIFTGGPSREKTSSEGFPRGKILKPNAKLGRDCNDYSASGSCDRT